MSSSAVVTAARVEALRSLAEQGQTLPAAAKAIGIGYQAAGNYARAAGIKFKHASIRDVGTREFQMDALFRSGKTLQEIGDAYCITRERVRQLLGKTGTPAASGGLAIRTARRRAVTRERSRRVQLATPQRAQAQDWLASDAARMVDHLAAIRKMGRARPWLWLRDVPIRRSWPLRSWECFHRRCQRKYV